MDVRVFTLCSCFRNRHVKNIFIMVNILLSRLYFSVAGGIGSSSLLFTKLAVLLADKMHQSHKYSLILLYIKFFIGVISDHMHKRCMLLAAGDISLAPGCETDYMWHVFMVI